MPETNTPESVNLTAAAEMLVTMLDDGELSGSHKVAAMMIWAALTGMAHDDAERYARRLLAADHPATLAHLAPL